MPNVYQAQLNDGTSYEVTTDRYHGAQDDQSFKRHLLDVIKNSASGIVSGVVVGYVLKRRG